MPDASLVDDELTFASFSHLLDSRLLRALADLGFVRPTLVQSKAIPLAFEGRDILARARTGSGKTAAYCLPVVQKIISVKSVSIGHHVVYSPLRPYAGTRLFGRCTKDTRVDFSTHKGVGGASHKPFEQTLGVLRARTHCGECRIRRYHTSSEVIMISL